MRLKAAGWLLAAGFTVSVFSGNAVFAAGSANIANVNSLAGAYLAARIAETDNDLETSVAYYARANALDPDNPAIQQSLLLGLITLGRFDEALPYAERLKETPEVERFSRLALGVDALRNKDYGKAEHWLKLALASDLDRLITGLMTGWAKLGAGDGKAALSYLRNLSGPEWYHPFIGYHRALIAEQAGEIQIARRLFAEVAANVVAGSTAPEAYLRALEAQAGFLARQGEKEDALATVDKALEFAPGRISAVVLRKKVEDGEEIAMQVPGPVEGGAEVLMNLATALNRGGGEAFVRLYLQYAAALYPESDAVLVQLAGVAEQRGDANDAIAHYEKISDSSSLKPIAELQLGLNLADLERYEEAKEHLQAALIADADNISAYLSLGSVYARQEDFQASADLYDKAAEHFSNAGPEHWNIFYQRGIAYERLKEWEKAEPNFKKALELYPDHPQVLNYLGYSWIDRGMNLEKGLELIERAVEQRPNDGYIVDSLGWAFYKLGRYDDAVRELERAVSLMPGDPILNDHLGDAYWQVGRLREAVYQWRHARGMEPDDVVLADIERKLVAGLPDKAQAER